MKKYLIIAAALVALGTAVASLTENTVDDKIFDFANEVVQGVMGETADDDMADTNDTGTSVASGVSDESSTADH